MNEPLLSACVEELKKFNVTPKEEQNSVLAALCEKKDSYCVLPTGSGKSMIFVGFILGMKRIFDPNDYVCIVISPLLSLNRNHAITFEKFGLSYWDLNSDKQDILAEGKPDAIITNPEKLVKERKLLKKLAKTDNVLIVIDEVHTILSWGVKTFRPMFKDMDKALSTFQKRPTILTLTATLTRAHKEELFDELGFGENIFELIRNPVLPNMTFVSLDDRFGRKHTKTLQNVLRVLKIDTPKCVIFTHTTNETIAIRDMLLEDIDGELKKYVNWCTAANSLEMRQNVVETLLCEDSETRIMITTSLLSLGVDMKGVKYVFITRMTNNVEELLQKAGRGGRDGENSYCILFTQGENKSSTSFAKNYRRNKTECNRMLLNRVFAGPASKYTGTDQCCSMCGVSNDSLISALVEVSGHEKAEKLFSEGHKRRHVSREDKQSLTRSLEELRQKINQNSFKNSSIAPCALTNGVINQLVAQARFIFEIADVERIVTEEISKLVLQVFKEEFEDIEDDKMEVDDY